MKDFGLILAPTFRSKAILQVFDHFGLKPAHAVLLPGSEPSWPTTEVIDTCFYQTGEAFQFAPAIPLRDSLGKLGTGFSQAPDDDANSAPFLTHLRNCPSSTYIYSGMPGCILSADILENSGKRFIHAHGGEAPRYSGSTAFYYSLLEKGTFGATAFWMEEALDAGPVLGKIIAKPHPGLEIDRIQDPLIRAETLASAIRSLLSGPIKGQPQNHSTRVIYHVIHPVLKHIALRKIRANDG